ncbi:MAG: ATP-binding protein, partial [Bacteroidales bacterium]|nr:ATP-binding protein [Bacteroidales bacterium]
TINKLEGFGKGEVITAEGKPKFMEAIRDFEAGILEGQHLELLCCDGCIQGPGMSKTSSIYERRKTISEYVKWKMAGLDAGKWKQELDEYSDLDLSRSFEPSDQRLSDPLDSDVEKVLLSMGRKEASDMLNCGACGYETCREHAVAVVEGLAETEMCLPYAIEKLHESVNDLNTSNRKLADTRQALKQSEKLASMGQVSAGIAHELNNPLGIITLYSSILRDELEKESNVYRDIAIIDEQAQRCQKIVGGLLNFARKKQVNLEECKVIDFVEKSFESLIVPADVKIEFEHKLDDPLIRIDRDQMMQVLTNLLKNAIEAMPGGGVLKVELKQGKEDFSFIISDTGSGISEQNMEKIFTPFFTTKDSGKGTGLGLPLAYGIVKMHKGKINVVSNNDPARGDTGTVFTIVIPANTR